MTCHRFVKWFGLTFGTCTGLCQSCVWVYQVCALRRWHRMRKLMLFLLPAADPLDLQEHLLLISLVRLLQEHTKGSCQRTRWLCHVVAVEATGENSVFSKACSPEQIIMPSVCIINSDWWEAISFFLSFIPISIHRRKKYTVYQLQS